MDFAFPLLMAFASGDRGHSNANNRPTPCVPALPTSSPSSTAQQDRHKRLCFTNELRWVKLFSQWAVLDSGPTPVWPQNPSSFQYPGYCRHHLFLYVFALYPLQVFFFSFKAFQIIFFFYATLVLSNCQSEKL